MKTRLPLALAAIALLAAPYAHAMSSAAGTSAPGAFAVVTDPDDKTPLFLKPPADNLDDSGSGMGFVSKDAVERSKAHGTGAWLPSDSDKQ